jgi:hypothetical protein
MSPVVITPWMKYIDLNPFSSVDIWLPLFRRMSSNSIFPPLLSRLLRRSSQLERAKYHTLSLLLYFASSVLTSLQSPLVGMSTTYLLRLRIILLRHSVSCSTIYQSSSRYRSRCTGSNGDSCALLNLVNRARNSNVPTGILIFLYKSIIVPQIWSDRSIPCLLVSLW